MKIIRSIQRAQHQNNKLQQNNIKCFQTEGHDCLAAPKKIKTHTQRIRNKNVFGFLGNNNF